MIIGIDIDDTLTDIRDEVGAEALKYAKSLNKEIDEKKVVWDKNNNGSSFKERYNLNYDELLYFFGNIQEKITKKAKPREDVSKYAPKTEVFMINPDKIKDVIGRGGEMITKIILECSNVNTVNDINAVKVDLEDDGRVIIYHTDRDIINKTAERIKNIAREVEIGKTYTCKVVNVEDFGIFVELWPGCEGLIHVSQLDTKRVDKPSDLFKVGDEVIAIATGYDKKGKLNLSRKDLLKK